MRRLRIRWSGVDADLLSRASALELYDSGHAREEGVVFAEADVETGEKPGAPLTDDDRSSLNGFAAECLDS